MKCPFCGQDMEELHTDHDTEFVPALVYIAKEGKALMEMHLDRFDVCNNCGFIAPFMGTNNLSE